jgi:hypothetical protein
VTRSIFDKNSMFLAKNIAKINVFHNFYYQKSLKFTKILKKLRLMQYYKKEKTQVHSMKNLCFIID